MNYLNQTAFEAAVTRIVPVPQQAKPMEGKDLFLTRTTKVNITAPTAEFGPVKTAGERIGKLFSDHCGGDCFSTGDDAVKVTLSIQPIPFETRCPDEAYKLTVTEQGIDLVGYGEKGLLYAVISLEQICKWDIYGCRIPAMEVLDWPNNPLRGIGEECRWGSDMMEQEEWMALLDDLANRKMNMLGLNLYGCWSIQYDNRKSEYFYLPVKKYPELCTPKKIKYWSCADGRWVESEQLPPIYRDNFIDKIFARARDLGIKVSPGVAAYGHNTLIPTVFPETSSKDEEGNPVHSSFCTAEPKTYEVLFTIMDQIIDDYLIPYGMDTMRIGMDEVRVWCQCPKCRDKGKGELYLEHAAKILAHVKEKGIKTVVIGSDMLDPKRKKSLGEDDLPERLMARLKQDGTDDMFLLSYWSYHDHAQRFSTRKLMTDLGYRCRVAPWNGYHHWSVSLQPIKNSTMAAEVNDRDGGEGIMAYSMWDRCADRIHDAIVEYGWNREGAGQPNDVTMRYALRHFGPRAKEAFHAYRLMDWCTEERETTQWSIPDGDHVSHFDLLSYRLIPYNFAGKKADRPYPRAFLDEALAVLLPMRHDIERSLTSISVMGREAKNIFDALAMDSRCDHAMAVRQAYECHNYEVLTEDWLAIFEIYDLTQRGNQKLIAPIARQRQQARMDLMARCERDKERFSGKSMALRQHAIFMHLFADIADYIENTDQPALDLMNIRDILSDTSFWLR